ncbi:hypothetical protein SORBI_3006G092600 [Sorghum bicolor]|uniref:Uncharacterized protein n=1 Tax=Sorghum bicolor TaxID=4558 RepID=C5Y970_SORBI|nr:hypothetical protein SORBI_3006G092600 [Sorghum bicolor]
MPEPEETSLEGTPTWIVASVCSVIVLILLRLRADAAAGQVPLLSLPSLEQIHVFIFVLAITHVVLSAITVLLGLLQLALRFICPDVQMDALGTVRSFFKQFYGLLTQDDYDAMRLGFFLVNHGDDDTWLHAVDFFARQLYRRQYFRKSGRRHFVPCCSP